jgi:hypothetical protein
MQLHFLFAFCSSDSANEGFVCISSSLIAESRSVSALDCPCIGVPPVIVIFVLALGFGDVALDDGFEVESEMSRPEAEGGSLGVEVRTGTFGSIGVDTLEGTFELLAEPVKGACRAAGVGSNAKAFESGGSFRCFELDRDCT